MNKNKYQSGFGHIAIIVVILVFAMVGAVGYVFYKNFVEKKDDGSSNIINNDDQDDTDDNADTDSDTTSDEPSDDQITYSSVVDHLTGSNLGLKYPSSWSMSETTAENGDGTKSNVIKITSPDDVATVELRTNISGIGGTCGQADISRFEKYELSDYPGFHLYSVVTQYDSPYYYKIAVLEDNDYTNNLKVGPSDCGLSLGVFSYGESTALLQIYLNNLGKTGFENLSDFDEALDTDSYKEAVKIVQTLYVEN